MATEKGHMKIVVHLVDKGAEINTIDDAGVSVYRESVAVQWRFYGGELSPPKLALPAHLRGPRI